MNIPFTWAEYAEYAEMADFDREIERSRERRRRERTVFAVNICTYVSAYAALFSYFYPFRSRLVGNRVRCTLGTLVGLTCYTAWYVRKRKHMMRMCEE